MISESQERMVAVVAPERLDEVRGGLRALGAAVHRDRRGDRPRRAARVLRRRGRRRDPGRAAHRRVPALRGRRSARSRSSARRRRPGRTTSRRRGSSSSTTSSSARAPCAGPGSTRPCSALDGDARARGLARRAAARRARPVPGRLRAPCSDAALNVACAGGEPLALTDCLNFGNPEKPEIGWELAQAIDGHRRRPRTSSASRSSPATSRSTTRPAAGRSRRRRSSAASGSSRDVTRDPRRAGGAATASFAAARRGRRARALRLAARAPLHARARRLATAALELALARGGRVERRRRRAPTCPTGPGVIVALAPRRPSRRLGRHRRARGPSDVRRLRHPRARPRRRAAHLLRPATRCSTAARSRPGSPSREHGRLTALRDLGLVAQVFDEQKPLRPPRRARDRAHALLDDRLERLGERAAAAPPRPRAHGRARPQRQPDRTPTSCATSSAERLGVDAPTPR